MRSKKFLSVLLAASMVFSMNSFAFADEVAEIVDDSVATESDGAALEETGANAKEVVLASSSSMKPKGTSWVASELSVGTDYGMVMGYRLDVSNTYKDAEEKVVEWSGDDGSKDVTIKLNKGSWTVTDVDNEKADKAVASTVNANTSSAIDAAGSGNVKFVFKNDVTYNQGETSDKVADDIKVRNRVTFDGKDAGDAAVTLASQANTSAGSVDGFNFTAGTKVKVASAGDYEPTTVMSSGEIIYSAAWDSKNIDDKNKRNLTDTGYRFAEDVSNVAFASNLELASQANALPTMITASSENVYMDFEKGGFVALENEENGTFTFKKYVANSDGTVSGPSASWKTYDGDLVKDKTDAQKLAYRLYDVGQSSMFKLDGSTDCNIVNLVKNTSKGTYTVYYGTILGKHWKSTESIYTLVDKGDLTATQTGNTIKFVAGNNYTLGDGSLEFKVSKKSKFDLKSTDSDWVKYTTTDEKVYGGTVVSDEFDSSVTYKFETDSRGVRSLTFNNLPSGTLYAYVRIAGNAGDETFPSDAVALTAQPDDPTPTPSPTPVPYTLTLSDDSIKVDKGAKASDIKADVVKGLTVTQGETTVVNKGEAKDEEVTIKVGDADLADSNLTDDKDVTATVTFTRGDITASATLTIVVGEGSPKPTETPTVSPTPTPTPAPAAATASTNVISANKVVSANGAELHFPAELPYTGYNWAKAIKKSGANVMFIVKNGTKEEIKSITLKKSNKVGSAEIKSVKGKNKTKMKKSDLNGASITIAKYKVFSKSQLDTSKMKVKNGKVKGLKVNFSDLQGQGVSGLKAKKLKPNKQVTTSDNGITLTFTGEFEGSVSTK